MGTKVESSDVIILGGGLVGLCLAVALDAQGLRSIVVDPADPDATLAAAFDGRASAVASAPWRMLQAIGVAGRLDGHGCPIEAIRVNDGLKGRGLTFTPDAGEGALGHMFENRRLRTALREAALAAANVTLLMPARPAEVRREASGGTVALSDGRTLRAPLVVGAEGRNSPSREAAGINVARWSYRHGALIGTIKHERPHGNTAYEIFYPAGPFALLPLLPDEDGRNRSAFVWTVAEADAPALKALSDRPFAAELAKRMGPVLGGIELASPRAVYPLGFHHAATITAERFALVGDAAHGIHPIAGQGVNLGYRDVAALVEVLVEGARVGMDLGDAQLLARYQRWRSLDTLMVSAATDGLTRLFGVPGQAPAAVRRLGLAAVERLAPLKDFFMGEARGERGALPKLLTGELA